MTRFSWMIQLVSLVPWISLATCSRLAVMGGSMGDDNTPVWERFIEWAGGSSARIGVISAASSTPEDAAQAYVDLFTIVYGAESAEFIPIHLDNRDGNSDPEVIDQINRQTGFFFSGGIQTRITDSFFNAGPEGERVESPALQAIKQKFADGDVVGGSSAGGVCHNTAPMITGGSSWNALVFGAFERGEGVSGDLRYEAEGGLGMLPGYIVDSHAAERGREGRLIRLVADTQNRTNGVPRAFGLDEGTALFITDVGQPNSTGEVVGVSGVTFHDLTNARVDNSGEYWAISDVRLAYITEGDVINLSTQQVTWASWKQPLAGNEPNERPEQTQAIFRGNRDDRLEPPNFVRVATSLYEARQGTVTNGTTEMGPPVFRVDFDKSPAGSVGYAGDNPTTGLRQVAYYNLKVDIQED